MFSTCSSIHDVSRKNPNFGACADSVYQALVSPHKKEAWVEGYLRSKYYTIGMGF